jgi:hypothetical protein
LCEGQVFCQGVESGSRGGRAGAVVAEGDRLVGDEGFLVDHVAEFARHVFEVRHGVWSGLVGWLVDWYVVDGSVVLIDFGSGV